MDETRLPKVSTQQEFMDELERLAVDGDESEIGRPRDLKTYIVEVDDHIQTSYQIGDLDLRMDDTGLGHIKILTATDASKTIQYYVDKTDERFVVLHTGELTKDAE